MWKVAGEKKKKKMFLFLKLLVMFCGINHDFFFWGEIM